MTLNENRDVIVVREEPRPPALKQRVEVIECEIIAEALTRHRWNRTRVARELGLSRVGLANKIRRYGLDGGESG